MAINVALCGLTNNDARLVQIVVQRAPTTRYQFAVMDVLDASKPQVAIVDVSSAAGMQQLETARKRMSRLVPVFISEHGLAGDSPYRLARKSLLLHVLRTLETVVDREGVSDEAGAVRPGRFAQRSPAPVRATQRGEPERSDQAFIMSHGVGTGVGAVQAPDRGGDLAPLTALVVDDSATVREQMRIALERAGIRCVLANDAESAMQVLSLHRFDLVFLDVVMPGMDGYELCRRIRKNQHLRQTPVLMLTSRASPFDRARGALLAGCDAYLVKPISEASFFEAVDKVLAKHFADDRKLMVARGYRAAPAM